MVTVLAEIAPVVNSTGDDPDLSPGDLVCDTGALNAEGDPECTLRAALQEANGFGDADVTFAIPVTDPGYDGERWTIALGTALPAVTATARIDGTSQPGWVAVPVVAVDGGALASGVLVDLGGTGSWVTGLQVQNGPSYGIRVTASNVRIADGVITGNGGAGVAVVTVSTTPVDVAVTGNAISGNGGLGVDLGGDGITENDSLDVDSGPNDLLNAPVISTALERFGTVTVDYLLDVPAGDRKSTRLNSSHT